MAAILAACGILPKSCAEYESAAEPVYSRNYPCLAEFDRTLFGLGSQGRSLALLGEIDSWFPHGSRGVIYPDYVGGVYLDRTGRLTILIVESRAEAAQGFIAALGDWVLTRNVTYSQHELNEVMDLLSASENIDKFAVGWGPATLENRVAVNLIRYSEEEIARFREEVLDSPILIFRNPREIPAIRLISRPLRVYYALDGSVTMHVTEQTSSSVTVEIRNNTELPLTTGYSYTLEFYDNGTWRVVPGVHMFLSLGLGVEPGGTREFFKCLQDYLHLPLAQGLHRIRKDVTINTWMTELGDDGRPLRFPSDTVHDVVAEFVWE